MLVVLAATCSGLHIHKTTDGYKMVTDFAKFDGLTPGEHGPEISRYIWLVRTLRQTALLAGSLTILEIDAAIEAARKVDA